MDPKTQQRRQLILPACRRICIRCLRFNCEVLPALDSNGSSLCGIGVCAAHGVDTEGMECKSDLVEALEGIKYRSFVSKEEQPKMLAY